MPDKENKTNGFIAICCIGVIIVALILVFGSMLFNNDNPDHSVSLVLGGKEFTLNNLTTKEINNIQGNNTDTINIYNEDGRMLYMLTKTTKNTSILNEIKDEDNITNVESNSITYHNIVFGDNTPSTTVFETKDGNIYEIIYYNSNDFLFDYKNFGNQLNK